MTNLITLTIPNDDHITLRAFGKALEEMALAHEQTYRVEHKANADLTSLLRSRFPLRSELDAERQEPEVDTTAQQVESLAQRQQPLGEDFEKVLTENLSDLYVESEPTTDSTGTPWDERIHSASKALNTDGTWRLRRKPKDVDELEWSALVESVKAELSHAMESFDEQVIMEEDSLQRHLCGIDPAHETPEPPVTPPGDDFHTDAGVVTEQTVAGIPPIPVPPPVVVPPAPEFDDGVPFPPSDGVSPALERLVEVTEQWTFPKLMTFLTERQGKIDVATVNMLLAQDGIASLPELNAHPDKIGPFATRVKAHLGE